MPQMNITYIATVVFGSILTCYHESRKALLLVKWLVFNRGANGYESDSGVSSAA